MNKSQYIRITTTVGISVGIGAVKGREIMRALTGVIVLYIAW
jgi:hypothetical protein